MSRDGKRFDHSALRMSAQIPGPGAYKSKYDAIVRKSGVPLIGKDPRKLIIETPNERINTPGPGTYRAQTDFGYYDDDDFMTKSFALKPNKSLLDTSK